MRLKTFLVLEIVGCVRSCEIKSRSKAKLNRFVSADVKDFGSVDLETSRVLEVRK
jgi:hypothetical protein